MKKLISVFLLAAAVLWVVSCQKDTSKDLPQTKGQDVPANVKGFTELGDIEPGTLFNSSSVKPEYKKPIVVSSSRDVASVTLFSSRADFMADCPDLPTEDFEAAPVDPFGVLDCGTSISSTANGCFADGELLPGFELTSTGGGSIVSLGTGVVGNTSKVVAVNLFTDDAVLNFSAPNPTAVGFDLLGLGDPTVTITVNGNSGVLWSGTATFDNFVGFIVSGDVITSIEFDDEPGGTSAEVFDNLTFGTCDSDGDGCPDITDPHPYSIQDPTIVIDGCDSGVDNVFVTDCSTMADFIADCAADATNHGDFVSCVSHLTNEWKAAGLISGKEKGTIQSCAAQASIP